MKFLRAVGWSRWAVEAARLVSAGNSSRQRPPGLLSAGLGRPVPFAEPVAGALVAASRLASSRPAAASRKAGRQAREPRLRMPRQRSSLGHFLVGIGVHLPMIACRFLSLPALFRPIALAESGANANARNGKYRLLPHCGNLGFVRFQWPRRGSNPHGDSSPRDFKSRASAYFATRPSAVGW